MDTYEYIKTIVEQSLKELQDLGFKYFPYFDDGTTSIQEES